MKSLDPKTQIFGEGASAPVKLERHFFTAFTDESDEAANKYYDAVMNLLGFVWEPKEKRP